jgi:DNA mismatch endonuclease Vsr
MAAALPPNLQQAARRSAIMRAVKSKDTSPERAVRCILRQFAPGYRLHRAELPGKPDIVYIGRRRVIFVHGCFWHGHDCARGARAQKQMRTIGGVKLCAIRLVTHSMRLRFLRKVGVGSLFGNAR